LLGAAVPVGAAVAIRVWLKEPSVTSVRALRFREDMLSLLGSFLDGFAERHGYAPDENTVALATQEEIAAVLRQEFGDRLPAAIAEFFGAITKVSLPDVHIGYFIGPPAYIVGLRAAREPHWADFDGKRREVLVFGSDGGGSLYAVPLPSGQPVYELPPAEIENGLYSGQAVAVADDFDDFLDRLRQRLREQVVR
jgi:hypothetical protein